MAERCALFVIIALGESLLVTGATFAGLAWNAATFAAFLIAVFGTIAMWWLYFDTGSQLALRRIEHSTDPGRLGRAAYTYMHALIVAGIIVCVFALLALPTFSHQLTPLALGAATTAVLVVVAVWESLALRRPVPSAR